MTLRPDQDVSAGTGSVGPRAAPPGWLAVAGVTAIGVGSVLILLLHLVPPSDRVNPMTRTISEYALGANAWMFNAGVLALAAGSVAVLAALAKGGVLRPLSPAALLVLGWAGCLVLLVVFQKYDHAHGQSRGPSGLIHRMSSLVAFLCLPAGALLAARAGRVEQRWRRYARRTRWAGLTATAALCLLFYAIAQSFVTGISWWQLFPLGAMERLIALAEVGVILALGGWAINVGRSAAAADPVRDGGGGAPLVQ